MAESQSPNRVLHWTLGSLFVIVTAAVLYGLVQYRDVPLSVAVETTVHTEPLNTAGEVDYFRVLENATYSDKIASEENGVRLLLKNSIFADELSAEHFQQACDKVGLAASEIKPVVSYIEPYSHATNYCSSDAYDEEFVRQLELRQETDGIRIEEIKAKAYTEGDAIEIINARSVAPWNEKDLPMMVAWVKENSPMLDLYAKAVRKPVFQVPMVRDNDSQLMIAMNSYHVHHFRSMARGYQTRAHYYLGTGEIRKAMDDVISCKRLGRHARNHPTFIDRLLGIAIEGVADAIGVTNVGDSEATKEDLEYFVAQLKALPEIADMEGCKLYEKFSSLQILQRAAKTADLKSVGIENNLEKVRSLGLNWNVVMEEFNTQFDRYWDGLVEEPGGDVEVTAGLYFSRANRSRVFAQVFADYMSVARESVFEVDNRSRCSDQIRSITLAMLRYEKDHGHLPPAFVADKDGKPLHSWRVLLLPYLGQKELFDQLRLDEPWDSPHNSKFASQAPAVFACPSCQECHEVHTSYAVILGKDLPFHDGQGKILNEFGLDSDDMILVAEVKTPIPWMEPGGVTQSQAELGINRAFRDPDQSVTQAVQLGSTHPAGAQFGLRNGAVVFLSEMYEEPVFKSQIRGKNKRFVPY